MFNGYDFVYDGKSSISENLKLFNIDGGAFNFVDSIPERDINLYHSQKSGKWHTAGSTIEQPLQFEIEFHLHRDDSDSYEVMNPTLERNRLSKAAHWLFDQTTFKKFQILSDEMANMYFMTIFKDVKYFEDAGNVRGFKCTAVCDTVGAWEEKNIKKTVSSSSTFTLQVLQDGIYEVMPVFTIDLSGTSVTVNVNGEEMKFINMTSGTRITVDCEKLIATSSEGEELYASGRFNKVFPTLKYGSNAISVTGNCTFNMNYKMIREVGC